MTKSNPDKNDPDNIVRFPPKQRNIKSPFKFSKKKSNNEPFFNFGHIPPFTKTMFWLLIAIHLVSITLIDSTSRFSLVYTYGFTPLSIRELNFNFSVIASLFLNCLLHADFMHLIFNLLMLVTIGMYFEKLFGWKRTAICFIGFTLAGNLAYFVLSPKSIVPLIGASGGLNGLFAISLLIMAERGMLGYELQKKGPLPVILIWTIIIMITGLIGADISWQAHLGGFLSGAALHQLWRKGKIRL